MSSLLRRIFAPRPIQFNTVAVSPGDYLILSIPKPPANVDIVGLLGAVQEQLPGVRIHLLAGFPGVEILRKQDCGERSGRGEGRRANPDEQPAQMTTVQVSPRSQAGEERPVVILRHCVGDRIVAATVPPEPKSEAFEQFHPISLSDKASAIHKLADQLIRAELPPIQDEAEIVRKRRLLGRKMWRAVRKYLSGAEGGGSQ